METFCKDKKAKESTLNLITHVEVEPAHKSDANALIPAIESVEARDLKPEKLSADSLYGSDDNVEKSKEHGVELIAPTMGTVKESKISLQDFHFSERGEIIYCPKGHASEKTKKKKRGQHRIFHRSL